MRILTLENVSKSFGLKRVIDGVDLSIDKGKTLCLLGPSGCGKTTLLRIVAGLEKPDSGRILFEGSDITTLEPHRRRFGMMFQDYALFPHMDVLGNVAFGLRMLDLAKDEVKRRAMEALKLVNMEGLARRNVVDLSGGERQRVALARTLAIRPRLVLLDEPLGSLDRVMRERLVTEIRDILKGIGATCIFVTHDQAEAYAVSDMTAVMLDGRIVQVDPPRLLCRNPRTPAVARFLGLANLVEGIPETDGTIRTPVGTFSSHPRPPFPRRPLTVLIHPDAALWVRKASASDPGTPGPRVKGVVRSVVYRGRRLTVEILAAGGVTLSFEVPDGSWDMEVGTEAVFALDPLLVTVLEEQDEKGTQGQPRS